MLYGKIEYKGVWNMYCPKCGKQIPDGSEACPECHEIIQKKRSFYLPDIGWKKMNFPGIIGAVSTIISLFLPTVKISFFGFSQSGNVFDLNVWIGILFIICAVLAIICFVYQENQFAMYCGIAQLVLSILVYIGIRFKIRNASSVIINVADISRIGTGLYLLVVSSLVMIGAARLYKK